MGILPFRKCRIYLYQHHAPLYSQPNDNVLDRTNFKAVADDNFNAAKMMSSMRWKTFFHKVSKIFFSSGLLKVGIVW